MKRRDFVSAAATTLAAVPLGSFAALPLQGSISNYKATPGVAKYKGNFTPPTKQYGRGMNLVIQYVDESGLVDLSKHRFKSGMDTSTYIQMYDIPLRPVG